MNWTTPEVNFFLQCAAFAALLAAALWAASKIIG